MKQNPFSLYDFMGYFIPGATSIYLIQIVNIIKKSNSIDLNMVLNSFPTIQTEGILIFFILSYVLGHLISYISSITIEKYAVWKYGYPSKYLLDINALKFWTGAKKFHSIFWRICLIILLLPTVILDSILGHYFGFKNFYSNKLDPMLVKIIKLKTNNLLNKLGITTENGFEEGEGNNSDFNRIILHYTYENSKNHQSKLTNYVAIYGFLRTFTLITNILFWYFIIHTYLFSEFNLTSAYVIISISIISYIFFMSFMKFYRRYTLEGLMLLTIDKEI
ncbi:MAG: hypothetical protein RI980_1150 [Bacteroidota bacterium]|jgi:hypothetical protein